ncbi:MAG: hypothetical protein JXO22_18160 [Phycisphaerae bacterium]|nr:hypothetical protein [Phycisphaerae bacterium]
MMRLRWLQKDEDYAAFERVLAAGVARLDAPNVPCADCGGKMAEDIRLGGLTLHGC